MKSTTLVYRRCKRKVAYKSQGAAEAHIRSLERREIMQGIVHAYVCFYCHQWHVGHVKQRA
jgi:hypothetical protein